jgi:hypothetical protein
VCVPPHSLNGACIGTVDGQACAWYWGGPNHSSVCTTAGPGVKVCTNHLWGEGWTCDLPVTTTTHPLPTSVCIPPASLNQVCAGKYYDGRLCVWPNGASGLNPVCVPTDAISVGPPVCVPPYALNNVCVGIRSDGAACAWINGGPLYHYACVLPDGSVEACSDNLFATIYGPGWHCLGEPLG